MCSDNQNHSLCRRLFNVFNCLHRLVKDQRQSYVERDHHPSRTIQVHLGLTCAERGRISYTGTFVLWSFALFWMIKLLQYIVDLQRLRELQNFYYYLLEIRDVELNFCSHSHI